MLRGLERGRKRVERLAQRCRLPVKLVVALRIRDLERVSDGEATAGDAARAMQPRAVADVIRQRAAAIGLRATGHSLRVGAAVLDGQPRGPAS